ncbi:MAG: type II toxin-antitoxin system Phd/YefM family antitoxin [Proteobacteria bacterium]|nr:type II toxin-antitoxin system Phd/YefM family antitoxin [Pseudomonadota bacterium]MBU1698334.1 type II toxin-antitoxin system Phd/YefM family antitoxin [Pseudomonadota bacterium]
MRATVVDLRYKMNDVLKALDRNEKVTVLYRGKVKGIIIPADNQKKNLKISEHPFFGMSPTNTDKSVLDELDTLRGSRYDDI